jgi:hypothetical protein
VRIVVASIACFLFAGIAAAQDPQQQPAKPADSGPPQVRQEPTSTPVPYWWAQPVATLITGIAAGWIAFSVYRLQTRQREKDEELKQAQKESDWQDSFRKLHEKFWSTDRDFKIVRRWIACDAAYARVKPILAKRVADEPLEPKEYGAVEKIDRFCAIMLRVKQVNAAAPKLDDLTAWEMKSYFDWWFGRMQKEYSQKPEKERKEFWRYVQLHWDRLTTP